MLFICTECNEEYDFNIPRWKCSCGAYLRLKYDVVFKKEDIIPNRYNMWRYEKAYPLSFDDVIASFDEGLTPLVKLDLDGSSVNVKMETQMPSSSFKDRGMSMVVNYLASCGVSHITEDSSGNAASSVAAYCALAGIECSVYVPEGNSSGKILQAEAYGAKVYPISGSREDVAEAAQQHAESYAGHNWHPMFEIGCKSIAYEIWEQNGFKAPDAVFAPCGGGGLALGLSKGFGDLLRNGQIARLPRIYAVQPEACNPVYRLFHGVEGEFIPSPTIAEGTSIAKPVKIKEIANGIRASGGQMVSVTDAETLEALPLTWHKGIYIEPTSAIAFAAFIKLKESSEIASGEDVVIVASGNGLKAGDKIKEILSDGKGIN